MRISDASEKSLERLRDDLADIVDWIEERGRVITPDQMVAVESWIKQACDGTYIRRIKPLGRIGAEDE